MSADLRSRAEAAVAAVADRLRDPAAVETAAQRAGSHAGRAPWHPMSLAEGHVGIALLFAGAGGGASAREHADRFLRAAVRSGRLPSGQGLFSGLPALAFAARAVTGGGGGGSGGGGDYARLLSAADRRTAALVRDLLAAESARRAAGAPHPAAGGYDAVSGLSGLGRYLLACGPDADPALRAVLTALVRCALPEGGRPGPDLWLAAPDGGTYAHPGLAHGVAGPLALLALAARRGVTVPRQEEAVAALARWLLDARVRDARGPSWPRRVPGPGARPAADGTGDRTAWCHGPAGVAAALALAGQALDEPSWVRDAAEALRCALDQPPDAHRATDASLCHGWGGLLHLTGLVAGLSGDRGLTAALPGLAARVLDFADPAAPYVFSVPRAAADPPGAARLHLPGLLDGACGSALALRAWLAGPASPEAALLCWDAALLLG